MRRLRDEAFFESELPCTGVSEKGYFLKYRSAVAWPTEMYVARLLLQSAVCGL
jgi:hypothetical protein